MSFQHSAAAVSCHDSHSAPYGKRHNTAALLYAERPSARPTPTDDPGHGEGPAPRLTAEAVFHRYAGRIYNLVRRMLANDADVEDVTQDVLVQVVRKLDTFRGEAELTTWLHRVAVNAALVHRRKRAPQLAHEAAVSAQHMEDRGRPVPFTRPRGTGPDWQLIGRETRELIEVAIRGLPEKYRDPFVLSDVEGLSNAEIAQLLGLSLPAVKSRLHRARLLLRDALQPHFEEYPATAGSEAVA